MCHQVGTGKFLNSMLEHLIRFLIFFLDAFATSLKQSKGKPKYSFYDGPPFATGLPHYGHILAGTIKVAGRFCE